MDALKNTTLEVPSFSQLTPESVGPEVDRLVSQLLAALDTVTSATPTFAGTFLPLESAANELSVYWGAVKHLQAMQDSPQLRDAIARSQSKIIEAESRISQSDKLYATMVALQNSIEFDTLPLEDRVAVDRTVRDLRLAGVALPKEKKQRLTEIRVHMAQLSHEFGAAVLDATQAWSHHVSDEEALAGLAPSDKAMLAASARAKGKEGWLLTLMPASVRAVMSSCENRELRRLLLEASSTRASDIGPYAGQFDNSPRIKAMLDLRWEAAQLMDYATAADMLMATRMATSPGEARGFLDELSQRARPVAERQLHQLRGFALNNLAIPELQVWDLGYVQEQMRRQQYAVNDSEIRAYFPIEAVLEGWQRLLGELFGLALVRRSDVDLWSSDASYFDVVDATGETIAGVYLDLHARPGKRSGAWMATATPRTERSLPVAYLTCNFPPLDESGSALLSHSHVMTLLHETGHCLNLMLTEISRTSLGGTNGVEWDAIEIPSQMMEDFVWDYAVLSRMSRHVQSGAPLPVELFERMVAARHFGGGLATVGQIEVSLFDLALHDDGARRDFMSVLQSIRDQVSVLGAPEWDRFPCVFQHVFGGAYAAGYYSYLWAEWFSADGFQYFQENGTVNRQIGEKLRREILRWGGVRPARDNFIEFRGRDPELLPMLSRRGLN